MAGRDGCLPSCPGQLQLSQHRGRHSTASPLIERRLEASRRGTCFFKLLQVLPKTQEPHLAVTPMCWARRGALTAALGRILTAGCSGPQAGTVMHDMGQAITLQMVHAKGVQSWDRGPRSAARLGGLCSAKPSPGTDPPATHRHKQSLPRHPTLELGAAGRREQPNQKCGWLGREKPPCRTG